MIPSLSDLVRRCLARATDAAQTCAPTAACVMAPKRTGTIGDRNPRHAHGHPSRRLSAQYSRRNTMTPSTARAVTTSLHVIATSSWCIVFLPLVLCHQDHCSQPRRCNTQPAVSRRRIPRSAAHRWVSRLSRIHRCSVGAWGLPPRPCTPRARVSTPTLWRPTCGYGRDAADRGDVPRCPCPKLGKMPISWHSAGARRRRGQAPVLPTVDPSALPPMSGHCASSTARFCQALTGIASREPRVGSVTARPLIHPRPPARRAPMVLNPGHSLCSGGKLTGDQVPRGEEAARRC